MNDNDKKLKDQVEDELRSDATVNASRIMVSVKNGVVSLKGAVDSGVERSFAEDAAKRVLHVRSVETHLTVESLPIYHRAPPPK